MKRILVGLALAGFMSASGCVSYSALAQGPSPDKVYITKTTWYVVWTVNKMQVCTLNGNSASNCTEVTEQ